VLAPVENHSLSSDARSRHHTLDIPISSFRAYRTDKPSSVRDMMGKLQPSGTLSLLSFCSAGRYPLMLIVPCQPHFGQFTFVGLLMLLKPATHLCLHFGQSSGTSIRPSAVRRVPDEDVDSPPPNNLLSQPMGVVLSVPANARRQRLRGADRQLALYANKTLPNQNGNERPTVPPAIRWTPSLDQGWVSDVASAKLPAYRRLVHGSKRIGTIFVRA